MANATQNPLVSIIIPSYNHIRFVCDAIESCLNQTYPHIEVIVIDDGSTDGTGELITQRYGDRVVYVYQENRGPSAARNKGVQCARGEYVHLCDADDQLLPEKIERSLRVFQVQPEVVLVYTQCHYVEPDGKTVIPRELEDLPSGDIFCELLCGPRGDFIPQPTAMIRRQAILALGGFNEQLRSAEDWDMWLRLAAQHEVGVVNEPLALYRVVPNAMHTNSVRMRQARLAVVKLARSYPGRERCLNDDAYDRLEAGRHHALAMVLLEDNRRAEARHHLRAAIRLEPTNTTVRRFYHWGSYILPLQWMRAVVNFGSQLKQR